MSLPDIIRIRPSAAARRRDRREVVALVESAMEHLAAVRAGELVYIHGAYLDLIRAVHIVMDHRLDDDGLAS